MLKTPNFWEVKLSVWHVGSDISNGVVMLSSSWSDSPSGLAGLLGCEDEGASMVRNVKKRQSNDAALCSRRLDSSVRFLP